MRSMIQRIWYNIIVNSRHIQTKHGDLIHQIKPWMHVLLRVVVVIKRGCIQPSYLSPYELTYAIQTNY